MAEYDNFTYISGGSLDLSGNYRLILNPHRKTWISRLSQIQSSLIQIKDKEILWVVSGISKLFDKELDFSSIRVNKCHFRLRYGKYLDNYAKFNIIGKGGFQLTLIIDPFIKAYYFTDLAYSIIGLFKSQEEAQEFASTILSQPPKNTQ